MLNTDIKAITPDNAVRDFLSGGPLRIALLNLLQHAARDGVEIYAALYELNDQEIINAFEAMGKNCNLLLGSGAFKPGTPDENAAVRAKLKPTARSKSSIASSPASISPTTSSSSSATPTATPEPSGPAAPTPQSRASAAKSTTACSSRTAPPPPPTSSAGTLQAAGAGYPASLAAGSVPAKTTFGTAPITAWNVPCTGFVDLNDASNHIKAAKEGVLFLMFNPGTGGGKRAPSLLQDIQALGDNGLYFCCNRLLGVDRRSSNPKQAGSAPLSFAWTQRRAPRMTNASRRTMNNQSKLTDALDAILRRDPKLNEELGAKREPPTTRGQEARFRMVPETFSEGSAAARQPFLAETIVLRTGRPVLAVSNDEPELTFADIESEIWRDRLKQSWSTLVPAIRSVGRIDVVNNSRFAWVSTGWLVRPDVIVTNRHVAEEFAARSGEEFVFRQGTAGRTMSARIDFLQEVKSDRTLPFRLSRVLHIEDESGPDIAFLRVDDNGTLAHAIKLSEEAVRADQFVAVIGYPARDSRIPDQNLMHEIFGDVYDKKRLAPGQITRNQLETIEHDCSTLGGNSGSLVLDLASGSAVGLHFAGRFLEANYAVSSITIAERLNLVLKGKRRAQPHSNGAEPKPSQDSAAQGAASAGITTVTCMISLQLTFQIGAPKFDQEPHAARPLDSQDAIVSEGVTEDYAGRQGFQKDFLGDENPIELPKIRRHAREVVEFVAEGKKESVLRYEHFSVVMNRDRRMCFFSAVNIDGTLSRKAVRTAWRTDPRIPKELQIIHECYGSAPKFSRGHMTRREDPVWGNPKQAAKGNSDSMHVTNVTPQMQSFNAPIWLGLEDYALQNARRDKMKISVITGPILRQSGPVMFSVKIPLAFFKVIAFLHDETGELTVTGYSTSQEEQLAEFVFGGYETWQRPLSWIEEAAGLSFGEISKADPLVKLEEGPITQLTEFEQIRFFE